jgi:DNA-binding NarL/FixJ family response regulator
VPIVSLVAPTRAKYFATNGVAVRVLIADDNPWIRKALHTLIEHHSDWQVCAEAEDGQQAVEKAREYHPDLIIMDFRLPAMNGLDAGKAIRLSAPNIPMLLITFYGSDELAEAAAQAGFRAVLSKSDLMNLDHVIESAIAA